MKTYAYKTSSRLYRSIKITSALSILLLCLPASGWATKVYSPIVEGGELEIEAQNDFIRDADPARDGSSKHQIELSYGVTERWQTGLYGVFENKPGQSLSYTQTKWENVFQLFEQGENWIDSGLYLEYVRLAASQKKPDIFEVKLLLEKPVAELVHTLNMTVKKPLGHSAQGTTWGYSWRSRWKINPHFEPSIEAYGTLGKIGKIAAPGTISHLLGAAVHGKLFADLKYDAGYLFGLTRGSVDGLIKLNMDFEF